MKLGAAFHLPALAATSTKTVVAAVSLVGITTVATASVILIGSNAVVSPQSSQHQPIAGSVFGGSPLSNGSAVVVVPKPKSTAKPSKPTTIPALLPTPSASATPPVTPQATPTPPPVTPSPVTLRVTPTPTQPVVVTVVISVPVVLPTPTLVAVPTLKPPVVVVPVPPVVPVVPVIPTPTHSPTPKPTPNPTPAPCHGVYPLSAGSGSSGGHLCSPEGDGYGGPSSHDAHASHPTESGHGDFHDGWGHGKPTVPTVPACGRHSH